MEKYKVVETLVSNDNYNISKAKDIESGALVVLKSPSKFENLSYYSRQLEKEYNFLNSFNDKHIVKALGLVENNPIALVTEYIDAVVLSKIIKENNISLDEKINIAIDITKSLGLIHEKGILHMDVKPSNILWDFKNQISIFLDFNISEKIKELKSEFNGINKLRGTVQYISPEQTGRINRMVDYRSDFYSLGITLYELFTNELPFKAHDVMEIIHGHIAIKPKPAFRVKADLPKVISDIIMKLISKSSEERYQSIDGIVSDFEFYKSILSNNEDDEFILGKNDFSGNLNISQKIYGGERETEELLKIFEKVKSGSKENLLLYGYSGVGKTTVVKELYRSITEFKGYFISGQFDQYNINVPYSALINAIGSFVKLVMSEGQEELEFWKTSLAEKLGNSSAILTQLSPELERLLGKQLPVQELGRHEAQVRLNHGIQTFFKAIADEKHPIVLFLDDLQWGDIASLNLLKSLYENTDLSYIYIIGAYRSNEVKGSNYFGIKLSEMENSNIILNKMEILPLEQNNVEEFLFDTFKEVNRFKFLVQKIMEKTKGNMFFVKQFIIHLYSEECIYFDYDTRKWIVDDCVGKEQISDNVAFFLSTQIDKLTPEIKYQLKTAACIGNTFEIELLADISDMELEKVKELIALAVSETIVIRLNESKYMFSHSQVQQAVYLTINESEREIIHSEIAGTLFEKLENKYNDEVVLEIAGHIKKTKECKYCGMDNDQIFDIFIKAGKIASKNIAYADAMEYLSFAEKLAHKNWENNYYEMLNLNNEIMLMSFMLGEWEQVELYFSKLKINTKETIDMGIAYDIKIQALMSRQQYTEGLETTIEALNSFGVDIPFDIKPKDHEDALARLNNLLSNYEVEDLLELDEMVDKNKIVIMRILSTIIPITFNMNPDLMLQSTIKMVELSVEYGNCIYSPFGYTLYGIVLCDAFGNVELGTRYGELSLGLLNKYNVASEVSRVQNMTALHILHFRSHIDRVIEIAEVAFYDGIENGDLTFAGFSGHGYCFSSYLAGRNLNELKQTFEVYTESLLKYNQGTPALYQNIYLEVINNLLNKDKEQWIISGEYFDEFEMLNDFVEQNHKTALFVLFFHKMQLAYLFKNYIKANEYAEKMEANLDGGAGLMHVQIFYQYASLIQIALYENKTDADKEISMTKIKEYRTKLNVLAESPNYKYRCLLVDAEIARLEKNDNKARILYEAAIESAIRQKFINGEALCRELASEQYKRLGNRELEVYYRKSAYNCYKSWGAATKANALINDSSNKSKSLISKTVFPTSRLGTDIGISSELDLRSVLKFSQVIASEIVLENLLKKLLGLLIETSGSGRAVSINFQENDGIILADYDLENGFEIKKKEKISDLEKLPLKVINMAYNLQNVVILNNASEDIQFSGDSYILENKIKSLLCFPIISQGTVLGLIYLENNLGENIFSVDRIEYLNLLSSQIAISLKNAMVYGRLEELVHDRTHELELKNVELQNLNEHLTIISTVDTLTNLYNRRKINVILEECKNNYDRYGRKFSVILLDIDYFKYVNDTYGHNIGDDVLKEISKLLKNHTRKTDFVGRWGGEEFIIICPDTDSVSASIIAGKVRVEIMNGNKEKLKGRTISLGVAEIDGTKNVKDLLQKVDEYLYSAKESGRNRVCSSKLK